MPRKKQPYGEMETPAKLVAQHAPLVKRIAHHLLARLPDHVQADDLVQAGLEGLLEAANKFESGKGASFETYAGIRIRGAMLDEIRRGDWSPRSVHRNARKMAETHNELERRLGRAPSDQEMAKALDVSMKEYHTMGRSALGVKLYSLEEPVGEQAVQRKDQLVDENSNPSVQVEVDDAREHLAAAIKSLPERDQQLLALYYQEELNLKEIGLVLGVSESRVSQLHSQVAIKLRAKLSHLAD